METNRQTEGETDTQTETDGDTDTQTGRQIGSETLGLNSVVKLL